VWWKVGCADFGAAGTTRIGRQNIPNIVVWLKVGCGDVGVAGTT
jgi:hypothetical protein